MSTNRKTTLKNEGKQDAVPENSAKVKQANPSEPSEPPVAPIYSASDVTIFFSDGSRTSVPSTNTTVRTSHGVVTPEDAKKILEQKTLQIDPEKRQQRKAALHNLFDQQVVGAIDKKLDELLSGINLVYPDEAQSTTTEQRAVIAKDKIKVELLNKILNDTQGIIRAHWQRFAEGINLDILDDQAYAKQLEEHVNKFVATHTAEYAVLLAYCKLSCDFVNAKINELAEQLQIDRNSILSKPEVIASLNSITQVWIACIKKGEILEFTPIENLFTATLDALAKELQKELKTGERSSAEMKHRSVEKKGDPSHFPGAVTTDLSAFEPFGYRLYSQNAIKEALKTPGLTTPDSHSAAHPKKSSGAKLHWRHVRQGLSLPRPEINKWRHLLSEVKAAQKGTIALQNVTTQFEDTAKGQRRLSPTERESYRVHLRNGQFYRFDVRSNGFKEIDTSQSYSHRKEGFMSFVMNNQGEIFLFNHYDVASKTPHSAFVEGSVLAAGELRIVGGTVQAITNYSGHFFPTERNVFNALTVFSNAGVDLNKVDLYTVLPFDKDLNLRTYPGILPSDIFEAHKKFQPFVLANHYNAADFQNKMTAYLKQSPVKYKTLEDIQRENKHELAIKEKFSSELKAISDLIFDNKIPNKPIWIERLQIIKKLAADFDLLSPNSKKNEEYIQRIISVFKTSVINAVSVVNEIYQLAQQALDQSSPYAKFLNDINELKAELNNLKPLILSEEKMSPFDAQHPLNIQNSVYPRLQKELDKIKQFVAEAKKEKNPEKTNTNPEEDSQPTQGIADIYAQKLR